MEEVLRVRLHNWRVFEQAEFSVPKKSFLIIDQNGTGKTSLLAAFYALYTGKAWPGTKFPQSLKVGAGYFGVSSQFPDWSLTGQISPSGRLITKYQRPELCPVNLGPTSDDISGEEDLVWPRIFTYIPPDNYWLSQTRAGKLEILDDLLGQVFGSQYVEAKENLSKLVVSKQRLLKHAVDQGGLGDEVLAVTLGDNIYQWSIRLWRFRQRFFSFLNSRLPEFSSWIMSPLSSWQVIWQVSGTLGQKVLIKEFEESPVTFTEYDWQYLWKKEVAAQKVLFGAQRDEFGVESGRQGAEKILSRGEMRLLVLFIKHMSRQFVLENKVTTPNSPIYWLLDDVFNELDNQRESVFFTSVLTQADFFIATTTRATHLQMDNFSLDQLKTA